MPTSPFAMFKNINVDRFIYPGRVGVLEVVPCAHGIETDATTSFLRSFLSQGSLVILAFHFFPSACELFTLLLKGSNKENPTTKRFSQYSLFAVRDCWRRVCWLFCQRSFSLVLWELYFWADVRATQRNSGPNVQRSWWARHCKYSKREVAKTFFGMSCHQGLFLREARDARCVHGIIEFQW